MKSFAELGKLKQSLQESERAERQARERARAQREQQQREARVFRDALGDVQPLKPTGRVQHTPVPPTAQPVQRERDEREALKSSLSDEIDIERLLDVDEALS